MVDIIVVVVLTPRCALPDAGTVVERVVVAAVTEVGFRRLVFRDLDVVVVDGGRGGGCAGGWSGFIFRLEQRWPILKGPTARLRCESQEGDARAGSNSGPLLRGGAWSRERERREKEGRRKNEGSFQDRSVLGRGKGE